MSEVVNVLVAFAVIVFLFRWATSGSDSREQRSAADTLGFRPKNVTPEMVDVISSMFPDIPRDNIRYDLLRTGSTEITTEKIITRGYLDAPPPAYYTLYPREAQPQPPATNAPSNRANTPNNSAASTSALNKKPKETLISRYNLEDRIQRGDTVAEDQVGGKAVWEEDAKKREESLKERKAQMILAARQRFLAQQQQKAKEAEAAKTE